MSFQGGLYDYVSAALSSGVRLYPSVLPQGVDLPAVAYQQITGEGPLHSHSDAQSGGGSGSLFNRVRVQFTVYARSPEDAEALADELTRLLEGYRGTWSDVTVGSVLLEGAQDNYDSDTFTYLRLLDAVVQYQVA